MQQRYEGIGDDNFYTWYISWDPINTHRPINKWYVWSSDERSSCVRVDGRVEQSEQRVTLSCARVSWDFLFLHWLFCSSLDNKTRHTHIYPKRALEMVLVAVAIMFPRRRVFPLYSNMRTNIRTIPYYYIIPATMQAVVIRRAPQKMPLTRTHVRIDSTC